MLGNVTARPPPGQRSERADVTGVSIPLIASRASGVTNQKRNRKDSVPVQGVCKLARQPPTRPGRSSDPELLVNQGCHGVGA